MVTKAQVKHLERKALQHSAIAPQGHIVHRDIHGNAVPGQFIHGQEIVGNVVAWLAEHKPEQDSVQTICGFNNV